MAQLTDQEKALWKKLSEKAEAPDAPDVGKSVSAVVDLGNKDQVAMAQKFGFLPADLEEITDGGDGGGKEGEEEEGDEKPKRRSYFE